MQILLARSKGIKGFVGALHSHPPKEIRLIDFILRTGRLSAGDLYSALTSGYGPMVGVADGYINSFAFRTRNSITPTMSQEQFYDMWEGEPQPNNVDVVIAEKYKLALYKGSLNHSLKRVV